MNKIMLAIFAIAAVTGAMVSFTDGPIHAQGTAHNALLQGVKADQDNYSLGESIRFTYVLKNVSSRPVTYSFNSSKQFDLWVMQGDKEVYRYSKGRMYTMALTRLTLNPGETKTFEVNWNQKDNSGNDIGPGPYTVYAQLMTSKNQPPATTGKVRIGVANIAVIPVSIGDSITRINELIGKRVQIQATYRGWQPNADDPNVKDGPPATRSDWAICDAGGCMYVTGKIDLDPVRDIGTSVTVKGKLQKTEKGQVYLVLDSATINKPS